MLLLLLLTSLPMAKPLEELTPPGWASFWSWSFIFLLILFLIFILNPHPDVAGMLKCVLGWCLPITYQKLESPSPDGPVSFFFIHAKGEYKDTDISRWHSEFSIHARGEYKDTDGPVSLFIHARGKKPQPSNFIKKIISALGQKLHQFCTDSTAKFCCPTRVQQTFLIHQCAMSQLAITWPPRHNYHNPWSLMNLCCWLRKVES